MKIMIKTERLILRMWKEEDAAAYFAINQDEKVLEYLPGPLTMEQVVDFIDSSNKHQHQHGYTLWAAELQETKELIGFIGLNYLDNTKYSFAPATEIGWRLGSQYWNKGFATEGAKAALNFGFEKCQLQEIVAFTALPNIRSKNVMEKIGMKYNKADDFNHPRLPQEHRLSQHILYRIAKS